MRRHKAADIHAPEIHGHLAGLQPRHGELADTARTGDAHRVEPSQYEQPLGSSRSAHQEIVVRRKTLRTVDELRKLRRAQGWDAVLSGRPRLGKLLPVVGQQTKSEVAGHRVANLPRLRSPLEGTELDGSVIERAEINRRIRIAGARQGWQRSLDGFAQNVMMLDRVERQIHSDAQSELASPHAARKNHPVGANFLTALQSHPGDPLASMRSGGLQQRGDARAIEEGCSVGHRTLGQSHRAFARNHPPVTRQIHRPQHVLDLDERPEILSFFGADQMGLDAKDLRHRRSAPKLGHALRIGPERQSGGADPSHVMPRLLGELGIQLSRVLVDLGHAVAGAQLTDHAGGMPGGSATDESLLEQHDILPARLGQMIGHRTAHNAATDDDHTGRRRRNRWGQREGGANRCIADVGGRHRCQP